MERQHLSCLAVLPCLQTHFAAVSAQCDDALLHAAQTSDWISCNQGLALTACCVGLTLYLLDLTYRLAQWMNTSAITGSLVSENLLTLDLRFDPVSLPCISLALMTL